MSPNMQLSTNTQAAADFWTQGPATTALGSPVNYAPAPTSPNGGAKASPMKKAHRLLRGRYAYVAIAAAVGAVLGGVTGFLALPAKWESDGLVKIDPTVITNTVTDQTISQLQLFIQGEVGIITSTPVADLALHDKNFSDAWAKAYGEHTPLPTTTDFLAAIEVEHVKNGPLIKVDFTDKKKEVSLAGCRALMSAYVQQHGTGDDVLNTTKKIEWLTRDRADQDQALRFERKQLESLAAKAGTNDLTAKSQAIQENLTRFSGELTQSKSALEIARQQTNGQSPKPTNTDKEFIYQQIASLPDHMMMVDLSAREEARLNFENVKSAYGTNHPKYKQAASSYTLAQERVDDYAHEFLSVNGGKLQMQLDPASGAMNMAAMQENVDRLTRVVADYQQQSSEVGKLHQQMEDCRAEIDQITKRKDDDDGALRSLEATKEMTKTINILDYGSEPTLANDKRKFAAAGGFLFGGLIPIGLMMLYGLTENRFRYSDDANSTDLAGVTLLGILPNLPDRLTDKDQASIAAHCVHQIRTMLQISRRDDEPQVLAVTSASSGDGKTSLSLALGLSYAACGARTLLIDCDLIAAGLTHRLNVSSPDGVLEAVNNRALLEYVRTTDIADVAILPVGTTHAHHASTLSPVALRRLLSEARKNFDIVIVDTGPVLGSIEASLVCAAADRIVLTVARDQRRMLVEKSIEHLQGIGGHLAGVVFNRAQARDFEKSLSGIGLRSRPSNGASNGSESLSGSFKGRDN